jgi:hypothetical protein
METTPVIPGCEVHPNVKVHIGGDQLTRERLFDAKRLLIGAPTADGRFDDLSPITSEYFHMAVSYKNLYNQDSSRALGTMMFTQPRIQRNDVREYVKNAYNADIEFFTPFVVAYIVEAVCQYFELPDTLSTLQRRLPQQTLRTN